MSALRPTTRHFPEEFERRRWPVKLIAGLIVMVAASDLVCLYAGTEFGRAIEREDARQREAAKPKRAAVPTMFSECSKRALQEYRTACYLRAQSSLTVQK